jgi:NAD(P)-dependent dehydrogenase (short-subunit alcohol dehydrogenase family)
MRLMGKVILVAGAGGIGRGLATRYAAEGARVVVGDIDADAAEDVAEAIRASGAEARGIHLDGADEGSVAAAVAVCRDAYGGLDGLHANFAYLVDSKPDIALLELPLEVFDETQRINTRGFYLCTRAALPALIERGGGSIVYTSSAAAHTGGKAYVAYAMSKAATHALMRHVASRYGPQGVRANAIAPALTLHPSNEAELPAEFIDRLLAPAAMKRPGRPEDIAAMGALLMSDEGSYVTGQVISVDGGLTMRP